MTEFIVDGMLFNTDRCRLLGHSAPRPIGDMDGYLFHKEDWWYLSPNDRILWVTLKHEPVWSWKWWKKTRWRTGTPRMLIKDLRWAASRCEYWDNREDIETFKAEFLKEG